MSGEIQTQPLDAVDFSGGITDNYLGGLPNQAKTLDNLNVVEFGGVGKLELREGSAIFGGAVDTGASSTRITALKLWKDYLLGFAANRLFIAQPVGAFGNFTEIYGPNGTSHAFTSSSDITVADFPFYTDNPIPIVTEWNDHLLITHDGFQNSVLKLIYDNSTGTPTFSLKAAGLPVSSIPSHSAFGAGANNYVYKFLFYQTYNAGNSVVYEDFGTPVQAAYTAVAAPNATPVTFTWTHVYSSNAYTPYDTANIKCRAYRTTNNGTTFYYVGQTTWEGALIDNVSDAALILNPVLYTEGGVVENDEPPFSRVVHVVQDIAYYAGVVDSGYQLNEVRHSVPGDIDSVPATFSVTLQDEIIGFNSYRNIPIAICKSSAYRIEGQYDLLGRGGMVATKISDSTSCVHAQSAVQTQVGLFWIGTDGIYWSDGYSVLRINDHLLKTHGSWVASLAQTRRVQGKYDHKNRRVLWTIQSLSADVIDSPIDCDKILILHLDFGISKNSCFSTYSGGDGELADSFKPTAIEFGANIYNSDSVDLTDTTTTFYRGDTRGYVLRHSTDYTSDAVIDVNVVPQNWSQQPIIFDFTTCAYNMGSSFVRKFIPRMTAAFKHETNLSVQISSINDDGRMIEDHQPIRYRTNYSWGDDALIWADDTIIFGLDGMVDEMIRITPQSLRCDYKQLRFTNAHVPIVRSDDYATGVIGPHITYTNRKVLSLTSATPTLPTSGDNLQPLYGYYIAFEDDNYVTEYKILESDENQIAFLDALSTAPTADGVTVKKWVVRGRPKDEKFFLIGFTLHYAFLGKTQTYYRSTNSGENS